MIPELLTPEEVSEKLKVTRRSVYKWLLEGKLRGLRAGDTWRIPEENVIEFLKRPATSSPATKPAMAKKSTSAKRRRR